MAAAKDPSNLPSLIVIVGPTASGKSHLAAELGAALPGEVISADSVQVYRGFDIGAGKPSEKELSRCPHHLIDIRDPLEPLEAAQFAEAATEKIDEIIRRGKAPIICGGTFLWIRALLFGLAEAPPADQKIRERHRRLVAEEGRPALHSALAQVDAPSAARLHPNDFIRVSRALEVFEIAGRPLSEIQKEHGFREPKYRYRLLQLAWERSAYETRLRQRIQGMLDAGLEAEVEGLLAQGYGESRAMQAIGYKQMYHSLLGKEHQDSPSTTESQKTILDQIVQVTRVFARRQRTWLRDEEVIDVPASLLDDSSARQALLKELQEWF